VDTEAQPHSKANMKPGRENGSRVPVGHRKTEPDAIEEPKIQGHRRRRDNLSGTPGRRDSQCKEKDRCSNGTRKHLYLLVGFSSSQMQGACHGSKTR
jgi:hypothetical protein